MDRLLVRSETISSIGHDPDSLMLEVEFLHGDVYQYFDVPKEVHADLLGARSIGRFFNAEIKNKYRYVKL